MKAQDLTVSCFFSNNGESIQDLLLSSFYSFLGRELQKLALGPDHHVLYP